MFFHVDLDAFYASVEQIDRPELKGRPVIVGGNEQTRGVVAACSYEARAFGVHSAQPSALARRLCPEAVFVRPRMARYTEVSKKIMHLFLDYTPAVQQISIDEAFLDMTGTERLLGPFLPLAKSIKEDVYKKTGLNVSIGISSNRYMAKMASAASKPNGLLYVPDAQAIDFLDARGIEKIWGVGEKSLEKLRRMGLYTLKGIREKTKAQLAEHFGKAFGSFLYTAVRAEDPGIFNEEVKSASISIERSFSKDIADIEVLEGIFLELAQELSFRIHDEALSSGTLQVKLRYDDLTRVSIQESQEKFFKDSEEIWTMAKKLFLKKYQTGRPLRLLGIGLTNVFNLANERQQGELFENPQDRRIQKLEQTIHGLKKNKGLNVTRARFLNKEP